MTCKAMGAGVSALLGALFLNGLAAGATEDLGKLCAVPEALEYSEIALPHFTAALKSGEPLRVVVIGTSSSLSMGKSVKGYPDRLATELGHRFSGTKFEIVNLSKRGQRAPEMEHRFASEVVAARPSLVIWQTGTVDAVRGADIDAFGEAIGSGIQLLEAHGADVVLMNMQYSPHTSIVTNTKPYRDYMRWVGQNQSIILFNRYAMMKYWEEADVIDFSDPSKAHQAKDADIVHGCVAYLLAEMIEHATKLH